MLDIQQMKLKLKQSLKTSRFEHSLRVADTASKIAKLHGVDERKAYIAGLVHDCAKGREDEYEIWKMKYPHLPTNNVYCASLVHAWLGSVIVKQEYGIKDIDIQNAVFFHTSGRANMSKLEMIVYLADSVEPARDYPNVKRIRQALERDLSYGTLLAMNFSIEYLVKEGKWIHPDTLDGRNELLIRGEYGKIY